MLLPEPFAAVGGFDERFFVYFEDLDLSRRVRASGKRLVYLAGPRAFHAGGGTTRAIPARRLAYFLRGKLRYARKHERGATPSCHRHFCPCPLLRNFYKILPERENLGFVGKSIHEQINSIKHNQ